MNLTEIAKKRYSTKVFDPSRAIAPAQFEQIKALLRYSPSSVNSQPWHFIVADTPEARKRMSCGTQGHFAFNEAKVTDASHVILFCVKTEMEDPYLERLLNQEDQDGRLADSSVKENIHRARTGFANLHRKELHDARHWMEKQVYLNMGTVLLGAGALGIDAVPMEGVDTQALDAEFGLQEKGYAALALVSLGYRADTDFNAALPKSRLPEEDVITHLK
jgi:nitroreductase/dihydropteridine reductase